MRTANGRAAGAKRLVMAFVELQIAMTLGAVICLFAGGALRAAPEYAPAYYPGSVLYFVGDLIFLTVPAAAWTVVRGRGTRCAVELAVAMLLPVAAAVAVGELVRAGHLRWLVTGMYPLMSLGMAAHLLYRREVYAPARAIAAVPA